VNTPNLDAAVNREPHPMTDNSAAKRELAELKAAVERAAIFKDNIERCLIEPALHDLRRQNAELIETVSRHRDVSALFAGLKLVINPIIPPGEVWIANGAGFIGKLVPNPPRDGLAHNTDKKD